MKREQLIILMIISVMVLSTFVYAGIQASPMIFPDKIVKPVEPSPPPVDMGLPDKDVEPGSGFEPVASCPAVVQPSGDLAPETACAIGVEPDPILEGQSLVHYLKLFNVELVSGSKLEFLKALHENVESKERKVNVVI